MKKILFLTVTIILATSCVGIKNNINRASVSEGEAFVKYGVEGFPEGVEVYKGSECMMTPDEIKRHYEEVDRANEIQCQERLYSAQKADEELLNYIEKVRREYQDTAR
jgi:hypothetical protein